MYTGISALFVLLLFRHFGIVFLYLVSLVGKLLGYTWNFYSKNDFKIQTCLFTKHESLQGDSPRVCTNILKCSLHSLVTKGIRLVGFATRAMVCESPTHYLIVSKFISDPWGVGRDL